MSGTPPRVLTQPCDRVVVAVNVYAEDDRQAETDVEIDVLYQTRRLLSDSARQAITRKLHAVIEEAVKAETCRDGQVRFPPRVADQIRHQYWNGYLTRKQLMEKYRMHGNTLYNILKRKRCMDRDP